MLNKHAYLNFSLQAELHHDALSPVTSGLVLSRQKAIAHHSHLISTFLTIVMPSPRILSHNHSVLSHPSAWASPTPPAMRDGSRSWPGESTAAEFPLLVINALCIELSWLVMGFLTGYQTVLRTNFLALRR